MTSTMHLQDIYIDWLVKKNRRNTFSDKYMGFFEGAKEQWG